MLELLKQIPTWVFIVIPWLWLGGCIFASIIYRKTRGKPIWYHEPQRYRFHEKRVSGNSLRTWYTRLGWARNALAVTVTDEALLIRPLFPFNLMFLPEIYDLEHTVPLDQLQQVERMKRLGVPVVEITFRGETDTPEQVSLRLRRSEEFLQVLADVLKETPGMGKGTLPGYE